MIPRELLERRYENVVLMKVVERVDQLLRADSVTRMNSIVLGAGQPRWASLTGLRGLGKEIWAGEEAGRYVKRLRREWDK